MPSNKLLAWERHQSNMCNIDVFNHAKEINSKENEDEFTFAYDLCLYYAKKYKSGKIKVKKICTGVPVLVGAENKGSKQDPHWSYRFKIHSKNYDPIEMLLKPKEFSSDYTFKKSIMNRIPILFTGNKNEFDIFIYKEMSEFDYSDCY